MAAEWGYDFFKIDFLEWTLLRADRYHDPSYSKAAASRRGAEIMRQAIGPNRHLLDCGPPANTIGFIDSARINLDYPALNWEQYFRNFNSNAPSAAKRYYFHRRTWIGSNARVVCSVTLGVASGSTPSCASFSSFVACPFDRAVPPVPSAPR